MTNQFETKKDRNARIFKELLNFLDMNQTELSNETGIPYRVIYHLSGGETKTFKTEYIEKICARFPSVNPEFLKTGEGNVDVAIPTPTLEDQPATAQDILNAANKLLKLVMEKEEAINAKLEQLQIRETEFYQRQIEALKKQI